MRIVMVGASTLTVATAKVLSERKHEVVIIERDESRLHELEKELDCGLMHGDGSRPSVLKEAGPESTDCLLGLGGDDQDNIIAALVGRELGFKSVIVKVDDPEYKNICEQLGLDNTIVPDLEIGRSLADMIEAREKASLTAHLKGELRFFSFSVGKNEAGRVGDLDLPEHARVIATTRGDRSDLADADTEIREGDDVLLILHEKHAPNLRERLTNSDANKQKK
jgi:trk system potassium uptake protein TrkA